MGRYVARRLLQAVPLLLGITLATFLILKAVPGGPLAAYEADPSVTPEDLARLEHAFGLDRPIPEQYLEWLGRFLTGDWGYSLATHLPVLRMIGDRLPNTVYLMGTVYLVTLLIAVPIGVLTAVRQYSWFDHLVTGATFMAFSTPTFWLGLLLIIVFGLNLRLFPLGGMGTLGSAFDVGDRLRHLVLPVATLSLVGIGHYVRYLRASMLETIGQDYMRTARAKGLMARIVIGRHAFKNAAIPLVTVAALDLPELFVGALVTEQIFGWPGMGRLFWDAATRSDYPILMGILTVASTLVIFANLLADVVYGYLDPRIRYS
ncbi:MAG TPA: ABC transporter permease [Candidatus Limnocylindria bacterium]|jgi:peptide/nickel transport system permease protein|nr:ABC transporter permease [Candidatus Limnocylindria bacterium]